MKNNSKAILLFVDWYLPGYKAGGPIQSCKNFAEAFKADFRIFIVTSDRDLGDNKPYPGIPRNEWISKDEMHIFYASIKDLNFRRIRKIVSDVRPDYIYLNSMFSFKLTIMPMLLKYVHQTDVPIVIAPRGMLQKGAMRFKKLKKSLFITLLNAFNIPSRLIFQATDVQEKKDILHFFPKAQKIFLADNFPTLNHVQWNGTTKHAGSLRCIFLSRLSPKKNILFFLQILRAIPERINIEFSIYGEIEDLKYWQKCQGVIAQLPENIKVAYHGPVSNHEIFEVFQGFHVFVLPSMGENFGHAIFEALLAGKPVIISDKTPWQELKAHKAGYEISLSSPEVYIEAIRQFALMSQEEYNVWSRSAAEFATSFRDNNPIKEKYKEVFN